MTEYTYTYSTARPWGLEPNHRTWGCSPKAPRNDFMRGNTATPARAARPSARASLAEGRRPAAAAPGCACGRGNDNRYLQA